MSDSVGGGGCAGKGLLREDRLQVAGGVTQQTVMGEGSGGAGVKPTPTG